jgi:hypothetical protein
MTPEPASRTDLRKFGLLVGSVVLGVGGWWRYRGILSTASSLALVIGGTLLVLGLLKPSWLRLPHRYWMALGEAMSFVMTRLILLILFALVVTPIGLARRAVGADPLRRRRARAGSYWEPYAPRQHNPKHYENMF